MKRLNLRFFKVAAIFSYVSFAIATILGITLFMKLNPINTWLEQVYMAVFNSTEEMSQFFNAYAVFSIFVAIINLYCGNLYNIVSNMSPQIVIQKKGSFVSYALIQILSGVLSFNPIAIISPIISIIGISQIKVRPITVVVATPQNQMPATSQIEPTANLDFENLDINPKIMEALIIKINELKRGKSRGIYSDEQYKIELNRILEFKWNNSDNK